MTDLLDLLKQTKQVEGLTSGEIAEQMGLGDTDYQAAKVRRMLKTQIRAGKVEAAKALRLTMAGTMGHAIVYRRVA